MDLRSSRSPEQPTTSASADDASRLRDPQPDRASARSSTVTAKHAGSITGHGMMPWLVALGLLAAVFTIYAQVLEFDFVDIDDPYHVTRNTSVQQGLTAESLAWSFTTLHAGYWIPATWISHMLDVEWFGLDPAGHHATNVLLHAANTVIVWLLLLRGTGAPLPSAFAAALFAVHPLRVESVAWITERKDVLSTFFGLLSIATYCRYARRGNPLSYAMSLLAMTVSLAAKPMLVSLPFVLLLIDFWPLRRLERVPALKRCLLEKLPYVLIALAFGLVTLLAQTEAMDLGDAEVVASHRVNMPLRLANASVGAVQYLSMTAWPSDLSIVYPHPDLPGGRPWAAWQIAGALGALVGITTVALGSRKQRPYLAAGWFWFLVTLAPVSGIIQSGIQGIADRFTYVPMLGLCVMVAWSLDEFLRSPNSARSGMRKALLVAAAATWLAALATAAWGQTRHWRNSDTIYTKALDSHPINPMLRTYYGIWLQSAGRLDEAAAQYRQAARIEAYQAVSLLNLASVSKAQNRLNEAIQRYLEVLSIEPDRIDAQIALGEVLEATGRTKQAIHHFDKAVRLAPENPDALIALANALVRRPQPAREDALRAVHLAQRAVALTGRRDRRALSTLTDAYSRAGDPAMASRTRSQTRALPESSSTADRHPSRLR